MAILDIFKKKATEAPPAEQPISSPKKGELGFFGSMIYGGDAFQYYNPDILLTNKGPQVYKKMMLDDQVKAAMRFKQYAVISRGYYFDVEQDKETGEPNKDQQEIADFFYAVIKHIRGSFTDKLIQILTSMSSGFSVSEKVYEPFLWNEKTWWGIRDIKLRPFETFNGGFQLDPYGNILELEQVGIAGVAIPIPMSKVIHFVHQPDIDPIYGESDLRSCYRNYWSKDIVIKFQNIHLERHASGFIWAKVTKNLSTPDKTNLENVMKRISALMAAIVPEGVDLNSMNPMRTDAFEKAIAQHDKAISKSILVPNLLGLSEQGQTGSYSQSQTQLDAFFWILDQIANQLAEALNEQLFRELALWNFGTDDFPLFTWEEISDEKKFDIAKAWTELVKGGSVTKSDADEAYIRQLIGFPEKSEDTEEEIPGNEIFPGEGGGLEGEDEDIPDNEEWIEGQPEEKQEHIRREFAEKPWMRRVDFSRIKRNLDRQDEGLIDGLSVVMGQIRLDIEKQIEKLVGDRAVQSLKPKEMEEIKIKPKHMSDLRKTLRAGLTSAFDESYETALKELPKKLNYKPGMDKTQAEKFLSSRTMRIAGVINNTTLEAVKRVLENGIKYDKSLRGVIKEIGEDTDLKALLPDIDAAGRPVNVPARIENIARTNTAHAMNEARTALFGKPEFRGFVQAFEYSSILDDRVSDVCESLNGRIQKDWGAYTPPNHFQCRSLLIPVTVVDEWSGKEDNIPSSVKPQKGFM